MNINTLVLCISSIVILNVNAFGEFIHPVPMNKGELILCPDHGLPGFTKTSDMVWIEGKDLGSILGTLNKKAQNDQFDGDWNYVLGDNAVTGKLVVDNYKPFDLAACIHGAVLTMHVSDLRGLAAGQTFEFLQFFTELPGSGGRSDIIDPPPGLTVPDPNSSTGTYTTDKLPFYDHPHHSSFVYEDFPSDSRPDSSPHWGGVSFTTLLTSWDGTAPQNKDSQETVYVYGAVQWGFTYACSADTRFTVPEPTTFVLFAQFGTILIGFSCSKRRFRQYIVMHFKSELSQRQLSITSRKPL